MAKQLGVPRGRERAQAQNPEGPTVGEDWPRDGTAGQGTTHLPLESQNIHILRARELSAEEEGKKGDAPWSTTTGSQ